MNKITKTIQLKIILFPMILIMLTACFLTCIMVGAIKENARVELETMSEEYLSFHKKNVKTSVMEVNDFIDFLIQKNKKLNLSTTELKDVVLKRYANGTKDDYIFIYKLNNINGGKDFAVMLLNHGRPELVGKNLSDDYKDAKGKEFRKEVLAKIRQNGEGYVKYWYKKPQSLQLFPKISYFYHNKDWDWIIAKGFYFDALESDINTYKKEMQKTIAKQIEYGITIAAVLMLISLIISYLFSKNIIRLVDYYTNMIKKHERAYVEKLQKFIDTQDNIVILSNGKEINFANRLFFNFFGYKDLESFKEKYSCICEHFISNDRFFHLGKVEKNSNWIESVEKLPHVQRVVSMLGQDFNIHTFSISINRFDEKYKIITFTDISATMIDIINLENKIIHDKLTDALNREYFDQNYKRLINEFKHARSQTGLAIIDIDKFKKINDTYGHDIGDYVLIELVKTIHKNMKKEDTFVRWGGEEFVLVIKTKSKEDMQNTLENIRIIIEQQKLKFVGNITCSIGATLYKDEENINNTIKRADEALYDAKANGRNQVVVN